MKLPPDLQQLIEKSLNLIGNDSRHNLPSAQRLVLYQSFGASRLTVPPEVLNGRNYSQLQDDRQFLEREYGLSNVVC